MAAALAGAVPADPTADLAAWVPAVNPNFTAVDHTSPGALPWTNNCGDCSRAVAGIVAGDDVRPAFGDGRVPPGESGEMWSWAGATPAERLTAPDSADHEQFTADAWSALGAALAGLPVGTVAVVGVDWHDPDLGPDGGHWFNAVVTQDGVQWVDGQTGDTSAWPPGYTRQIWQVEAIVREPGGTWTGASFDQRPSSDTELAGGSPDGGADLAGRGGRATGGQLDGPAVPGRLVGGTGPAEAGGLGVPGPAGDGATGAVRRVDVGGDGVRGAGGRAGLNPVDAAHGWSAQLRLTTRLTDLRQAAGADVVLAGAGLLRVTPLDGSSEPVVVRVVRGDTPGPSDRAMATTEDPTGARPTITVSDRAPLAAVRQALAHEIAELVAVRSTAPRAAGVPDAGRVGRYAELRLLGQQLTDGDPWTRTAALAGIPPLLAELGLDRPADGTGPTGESTPEDREYARRWTALPADLRPLVRALNDLTGPGAAPTAVTGTWRYALKNAIALAPVLAAQGVQLGISLSTGQVAGALSAGTSLGALAAAAAVTTRLEREFARGAEQRTALADAQAAAPAGVAALDDQVRLLTERSRAADERLVGDLARQVGAVDLAAELPDPGAAPARPGTAGRADTGVQAAPEPVGARAKVLSLGRYLVRYGNGPLVAAAVGVALNVAFAAALALPLLPAVASLAVAAGVGYASAWAERALAQRRAHLDDTKQTERGARASALETARADLRTATTRTRLAQLTAEEDRLAGRTPDPAAPPPPAAAALPDADLDRLRELLAARARHPGAAAAREALATFLADHGLAASRLTEGLDPLVPLTAEQVSGFAAADWVRARVTLPADLQTALEVWDDAGPATPGVAAHLPKWGVAMVLPALGAAAVLGALAPGNLVVVALPAVSAVSAPLAAWAEQRYGAAQEQAKDRFAAARGPGAAVRAARAAHDEALLDLVDRARARVEARTTAAALARARHDLTVAAADRIAVRADADALAAELAAVPPAAPGPSRADQGGPGERADAPVLPTAAPPVPPLGESALRFALPAAVAGTSGVGVGAALLATGVGAGTGGLLTGTGPALLTGIAGSAGTALAGVGLVAGERLVGNDVVRRQVERDRHLDRHTALLVGEARAQERAALAAEVQQVQVEVAALLDLLRGPGPFPTAPPSPRSDDVALPADPVDPPRPAPAARPVPPTPDWLELRRLATAPRWDRRRVTDVEVTEVRTVEERPFPPAGSPTPQPPAPQSPQPPSTEPPRQPEPAAPAPAPSPPRPPSTSRPLPPVPATGPPGSRDHRPGGGAPHWRHARVDRLAVQDGPTGRTVSALVQLTGPDGRPVRVLVRVLLAHPGKPVVLVADLGGAPVPGMVAAVVSLVGELGPHSGLPEGWAGGALWMVQCPSGPRDPYGLLREVQVAAGADGLHLTGRDRVLPPEATAALVRERAVLPVADAVLALTRVPAQR